ncbi:MAG: hypothetical protein QOG68_903 [Solirubrobacteraceae bacterium]|nr:hypothetical protein [Solirubrobacteraceae bacterium]
MRRLSILVPLALALTGPAGDAAARSAQPLVDLAPTSTAFRDHVGPTTASQPRAAGDSAPAAYATRDGQTVSIVFSKSYTPDPVIAQTYVDFLGGLPHGSELSRLKIYIATPKEVRRLCGGEVGTLACYDPTNRTMTVPGEQTADDGSGVTTSYVIAHEYGHHIARFRASPPFSSLAFGPRYWASYEKVCANTIRGRLFPGDEGSHYLENPGEAWADTYAHITYPNVMWQFTPLLRPTTNSKAAAMRDVLTPWTKPATAAFSGAFVRGGPDALYFTFPLTLDGSLRIQLHGPAHTNYDLAVFAQGRNEGRTTGPHSSDVYRTTFACREVQTELVRIKVLRTSGFGPFTVGVTYAG